MRQSNQKNFKIYRSSAGSGKTFTLVKEYLKLLLVNQGDRYFRHISAITFTNKAAREMKQRILDSLSDFALNGSSGEKADLLEVICLETGLSEKEIQSRSAGALRQILHHYSDFRISTIDSFLHRLIRAFSYELALYTDINIETDEGVLINEAVDRLFAEAEENKGLSDFMYDFIRSKTDNDKSWKLKPEIKRFASNIFREESSLRDLELSELELEDFKKIRAELSERNKADQSLVNKNLQSVKNALASNDLSEQNFYKKSHSFINRLKDEKRFIKEGFTDAQLRLFESEEWAHPSSSESDKAVIDKLRPEIQKAVEESLSVLTVIADRNILLKNIHNLALYHKLKASIDMIKLERRCIHISEFNDRIAKLLSIEEVQYIYERTGNRLWHYLIDEFQDTSKLQWYDLIPLVQNSLAEGKFNLVVGDAKQSIYRFRNGDMMQFVNLPEVRDPWTSQLLDSYRLFESASDPDTLNDNWRSKKEIVEFNNEFYSILKNSLREDFQAVYDEHQQKPKKSDGGYVKFKLYENERRDWNEVFVSDCLDSVRESLSDGYSLSDICVIVRTKAQASMITQALSEDDKQIITENSLLILHNDTVLCILHFLYHISRPSIDRHEAECLRYLSRCRSEISWQNLVRAIVNEQMTFIECLQSLGIKPDIKKIKGMNRMEQVLELCRAFKFDLSKETALAQFVEECDSFDRDLSVKDHQFFDYIEAREEKLQLDIQQSTDAIQIMTIHKSKGLEFPVVIIPFTDFPERVHENYSWTNELDKISPLKSGLINLAGTDKTSFKALYEEEKALTLADNANMLYVATTRAKERLYIFAGASSNGGFYKHLKVSVPQMKDWDSDKGLVCLGSRNEPVESPEESSQDNNLSFYLGNSWTETFELSLPEQETYLLDWSNPGSKGKIIHELLAEARDQQNILDKLDEVAEEYNWSSEQFRESKKMIKTVLAESELQEFFDPENLLLIERDFISESGELFRPDRVLVRDKQIEILDFKSGEKKEKDKKQIAFYAEELSKAGFKVDRFMLYYLQDQELSEC